MFEKLGELAVTFGKIGLFGLGGGNSMIFLIEEEFVERLGWLTETEYSSMLGMSFLFPGLTAIKVAGTIGFNAAGLLGLVVSVIALTLPGLALMVGSYRLIVAHKEHVLVGRSVLAMRYAAIVMIAAVLFSFGASVGKADFSLVAAGLSVVLFAALAIFNVNAIASLLVFIGLFVLLVR